MSLMWYVSTANGELYLGISSLRIVPEPKHDTYSASALVSARHGPTQWVAHVAADLMAHGGVIDYNKVKKEVDYLRKHPLEVLSRSRSNTVLIDWLKDRLAKLDDLVKLAQLLNRHDINLDGREKIWLRVLA